MTIQRVCFYFLYIISLWDVYRRRTVFAWHVLGIPQLTAFYCMLDTFLIVIVTDFSFIAFLLFLTRLSSSGVCVHVNCLLLLFRLLFLLFWNHRCRWLWYVGLNVYVQKRFIRFAHTHTNKKRKKTAHPAEWGWPDRDKNMFGTHKRAYTRNTINQPNWISRMRKYVNMIR